MEDYDGETAGNITDYGSEGVEKTGTDILNQVQTTIPFTPLGIGIIIITIFGIFGNLLSGLVLSRKRLQSSYSVLTLGLTFVDTVYLVTKFLRYGIESLFTHYQIAQTYTFVILPIVGPYLRPITFTAHTASTYFTIAIAVDRYMAVNWPAKARKYCTRRLARFICLLVIAWSIVFNATRWLEHRTVEVNPNNENSRPPSSLQENQETSQDWNSPIYIMKITELRNDSTYRQVYIFWIYLFVMFIIPFASLTVLNLYIFIGVRRMGKNGASLTSTERRDTSFAVMLIGVVVVFLICNVDYLILDILEYCGIEFSPFWNHLGNLLLTINSAVNFLIYCVCGWKFRQELWRLIRDFCPCLKQHGSHDIAATDECQWVKDTMNHMDLQTIPRVTLSKSTSKNEM